MWTVLGAERPTGDRNDKVLVRGNRHAHLEHYPAVIDSERQVWILNAGNFSILYHQLLPKGRSETLEIVVNVV